MADFRGILVMVRKNMRNFAACSWKSTLTADKAPLPSFAEASWWPTEYFHDRIKNFNDQQSTRCWGDGVLSRQTECLLQLRKHSDGATECLLRLRTTPIGWYSTWCYSDGALSRQTACLLQLRKHFDGGDRVFLSLHKHRNSRQSACHNGRNILTADRVLSPFCHTRQTNWQREGGGTWIAFRWVWMECWK